MFNMSEAGADCQKRDLEMSFKHYTATALGPVKLPKAKQQATCTHALTHTHTHTLKLSAAFCSLSFPSDAKCR